jgi:hypothetical protein
LLQYGAGIALPIAALGLFVGLRAWSVRMSKETAAEAEGWPGGAKGQAAASQEIEGAAEGQQ